jgi:hypothetical protein
VNRYCHAGARIVAIAALMLCGMLVGPSFAASSLKTVTTSDGTASVGVPNGWKLAKGSNGYIFVTGPNGEGINLGVLVIGKNASGGSLSGEVAFALPFSASLRDKFTTILQSGAAKQGHQLNLTIAQERKTRLPMCSMFTGSWTTGSQSRSFEGILCSLQPDILGLYKNLTFLAQVPTQLAAQDRPIVQQIANSYRVTPAMFKRMLAPYTPMPPQQAGGGAGVMAPYQDPTNSDCFDYNVIRESPPWEVPMHCGGYQPG